MFRNVRPLRIADTTSNMEAEVTEMIAIPIPPMEPFVSGGEIVWAGVVAAAILIVALAVSAWVNLRNRNVDADPPHDEVELPKAA
jgi:hypothetical protein